MTTSHHFYCSHQIWGTIVSPRLYTDLLICLFSCPHKGWEVRLCYCSTENIHGSHFTKSKAQNIYNYIHDIGNSSLYLSDFVSTTLLACSRHCSASFILSLGPSLGMPFQPLSHSLTSFRSCLPVTFSKLTLITLFKIATVFPLCLYFFDLSFLLFLFSIAYSTF